MSSQRSYASPPPTLRSTSRFPLFVPLHSPVKIQHVPSHAQYQSRVQHVLQHRKAVRNPAPLAPTLHKVMQRPLPPQPARNPRPSQQYTQKQIRKQAMIEYRLKSNVQTRMAHQSMNHRITSAAPKDSITLMMDLVNQHLKLPMKSNAPKK